MIYTARGRFTDQVKPIGGDGKAVDYCLPAHHGDYFLSIKLGDRLRRSKNVLSVHLGGDKQPFATLPGIELPDDINAWDREAITTDQRVHLIPAAKLIMTIPVTNDKLVLHRFDPEEALEKSGLDYLIVTSQPPATVKRGTEFRYQVVVKSKKGGVKFKIESGPQGMIVSDKGLVTWTVPPTESLRAREVILRITGAGGQERFQTFKVNVQLQRRVSRESPAIPPRTSGMQK